MMPPQSYEAMIQGYLTQPVQVVSAANAVDELFNEFQKPLDFWVPLHLVCASVYEPHRSIPETHKMLNFMKIDDARSYFWKEVYRRKLYVVELKRGDTWENSAVRFSKEDVLTAEGRPGINSRGAHAKYELVELMEEALRVLSSIARVENAKVIGQL